MAMLCVAGLTVASCGGDDEDEPKPNPAEQGGGSSSGGSSSNSNPMVGKTITCDENINNGSMRVKTNFSIRFNSATRYTQTLLQKAEERDFSGTWTTIHYLNKEEEGTYEYTSAKITLHSSSGGTTTLTKVSGGWKDGNYIYK